MLLFFARKSKDIKTQLIHKPSPEANFRLPVGIIRDLVDLSQREGNEELLSNLPIKTMKIILALFKGMEEYTEEFALKLPLSAIRKLIVSYLQGIKYYDQEWIYLQQTGGSSTQFDYYHRNSMLKIIERELNREGLKGRKIIEEEFTRNFKKDYDKMKKFQKEQKEEERVVEAN